MTDDVLLENVADTLGRDKIEIELRVRSHINSGMLFIYGRTKPYWLKTNETISITGASSDYLQDLRSNFPDFMRLRMLRVSGSSDDKDGILEPFSEGRFRREYPDDTDTGTPERYIVLDRNTIQLHPRPNASLTLNVSYWYRPEFQTITDMPEEWHHVIMHYVLMMFDPEKWTSLFWSSLKDIIEEAKFSDDEDIEILQEGMITIIRDTSDDLYR